MEVMNMKKKRKQYTADEKMAILRQHLLEKRPVSEVCNEYGLQPTVFYRWQKQLFERGSEVLRSSRDPETTKLKRQITQLEEKLAKKDEVLGEVMEEYVTIKKELGAP
jgi:transposase-like protein